MGKYGIGQINDNGKRLIAIREQNDLNNEGTKTSVKSHEMETLKNT